MTEYQASAPDALGSVAVGRSLPDDIDVAIFARLYDLFLDQQQVAARVLI